MKSHPEVIELDKVDLESKLDQIAAALGEEMAQPFRQLLDWYACLLGLLREKKLSLARLRRMLFGATTESSNNVLSSDATSSGEVDHTENRSQGVWFCLTAAGRAAAKSRATVLSMPRHWPSSACP